MSQSSISSQPLGARFYEEYRERRYLRNASDQEVMQRMREISANIYTLTPEGKIGCVQLDNKDNLFLWRLFSHVAEESRLRTGDPLGLAKKYGMNKCFAAKPTWPTPAASADVIRLAAESRSHHRMHKFGQRDHMRALFDHGRLRISPATSYNDPSLRPAIADDELAYELSSTLCDADLKDVNPSEYRLADVFKDAYPTRYKVHSKTNFYPVCLACNLDLRLFDDFGADTVLVIKEPLKFTTRIIKAARKQLPRWHFTFCSVRYFDPMHPTREVWNVFRSKHFRYQYQSELRFVFLPPEPTLVLSTLWIEMGSLEDIAEIAPRY